MTENTPPATPKKRSGLKTFLIVLAAVFLAIVLGAWVVKTYIFPDRFKPVALNQEEQQTVNGKLQALGYQGNAFGSDLDRDADGNVQTKPYSEAGANREIRFSQRELNGLLANQPDLAQKMALNLSDDLASAKLLLPIPEDFPFMPGKTLKITAGVEMAFNEGRPSFLLKGVSVWGVPIPNEWLGNLKNVDLVEQFGDQGGFWQSFSAGIEQLSVRNGEVYIKLKE